jgi:hypothetical protein
VLRKALWHGSDEMAPPFARAHAHTPRAPTIRTTFGARTTTALSRDFEAERIYVTEVSSGNSIAPTHQCVYERPRDDLTLGVVAANSDPASAGPGGSLGS